MKVLPRSLRQLMALAFLVGAAQLLPAEDEPAHESGATFWSFLPLENPPPPPVHDTDWVKSRLDRFVLARMEQQGLVPVQAASKRTLIRRATLDLIGLPPTPEEIHAFLRDTAPDAFSRVVDRLLQSPHYGERWGRHWLDVARYGEEDILGEYNVPYENAWRYRDWVVNAFNQDLPYDLFVQAQVAGDLLTDAAPRLTEKHGDLFPALGLFGIGPWQYGNSLPQEARADERDDRIDVVTRGFLGLTVTCARCHDHKYDPISMADYYALAGVFTNTAYREYPVVPDNVVDEHKKKKKKRDEVRGALNKILKKESQALTQRLVSEISRYLVAAWKVLGPQKQDLLTLVREGDLDQEQLEKWVRYVSSPYRDHPYLQPWDSLIASGGTLEQATRVADDFQDLVASVIAEKKRIQEELRLAYEARSKKHKELTKDKYKDKPRPKPRRTNLPNEYVAYEPVAPDPDEPPLDPITVKPVPRDRYNVWADLFDINEALEDYNIKERRVILYEGRELDRFLDSETKKKVDSLREELEALEAEIPKPRIAGRFSKGPAFPYAMAVQDREDLVTVRMHLRGSPFALGAKVPSRFLSALSDGKPTPFREGSGRLELAKAVADHPLAARVMVNRVWLHHFGKAIVDTPSNFGQLGSRPSHPQLLEYLAYRFKEFGWSLKALHREILLSATYQLSHEASTSNLSRDPASRFYWRASRRRLEVEAIRDGLSFVAGTLERRLGGPSYDLIPEFRRRTLYGRVSRFKLSNSLALFDFPDPRLSAAKRMSTNSPLQRLFFLNNEFVWRQAEAFAERLRQFAPSHEARIQRAHELLYGREATDDDVELGSSILQSLDEHSAWQGYAHILMSSNEFLFVE